MIHGARSIALLAVIAAMSSTIARAEQGLVPRHALSSDLAVALASRAVQICAGRGSEVSVSIADADGEVRITISSDGVSPLSIETARRKARAAAILRFPTSKLAEAIKAAPEFAAMLRGLHPEFVFLAGGLPIRAGNEVVGAIGVGGAPDGDRDESCAADAVAQFGDHFK